MKPQLDPRMAPLFSGVEQAELFNLLVDPSISGEQKRIAKIRLMDYAARGPDRPFGDYLLRLLNYYDEHPNEAEPISFTNIPRFRTPTSTVRNEPTESRVVSHGMWDF